MADLRHRATRTDSGFTLVEVIVAMGIFLVVTTALLPLFIGGIRSVAKADTEGVTNGILQQQLERLRGLPYRVSLGSDSEGTDADVDLLDNYFPDLKAPTSSMACTTVGTSLALPESTDGTGYIAAGQPRCSYEPQSGPFYRTVRPTDDAELGAVALVIDLQFMGGGSYANPTPAAATPTSSYDSNHAVTNYPPSSQVTATVTVLYRDRGRVAARSLATQIAKHDSGPTLVRSRAEATAVQVTSMAPSGATESLTAGVVSIGASVGDISTADVSASGVVARVATGDPTTSQLAYGAATTIAAPPSFNSSTPVDVIPDWGSAGCQALLCFGQSHVDDGAGVSTDSGLPTVGSLVNPVRASVTGAGATALTFDNVGSTSGTHPWSGPVVQLTGPAPGATADCTGFPTSTDRVSGAAYLATTMHPGSQTLRDTAVCAGAHATTLQLLAIPTVPNGVLQVTLTGSSATCSVTGGSPAGARTLSATVRYWNGSTYEIVDLSRSPSDYTIAFGPDKLAPLSDYVDSWSYDAGTTTKSGSSVDVDVPGLTVTTAPTRETVESGAQKGDSAVIVTVGAASCSSETDS